MKTARKLPAARHDRLIRFFLCGDFGPGRPVTYVSLVRGGYVSEIDRRPVLTPKGRAYCEANR